MDVYRNPVGHNFNNHTWNVYFKHKSDNVSLDMEIVCSLWNLQGNISVNLSKGKIKSVSVTTLLPKTSPKILSREKWSESGQVVNMTSGNDRSLPSTGEVKLSGLPRKLGVTLE